MWLGQVDYTHLTRCMTASPESCTSIAGPSDITAANGFLAALYLVYRTLTLR